MVSIKTKHHEFTVMPFFPSKKHLDYIRGKLLKVCLNGSRNELSRIEGYIKELENGKYYNVLNIAQHFGIKYVKASVFWRSIVVIGAIKRVEFALMKPCLVHESEIDKVIDFFTKLKSIGRGWTATIELVRESLGITDSDSQKSNVDVDFETENANTFQNS